MLKRMTDRTTTVLEAVEAEELLRLHERHFGPLDPRARARLAQLMRREREERGWPSVDRRAA